MIITKKKNKKQQTVKQSTQQSKQQTELKFQDALKLFFNTCEMKFIYWFEKRILPIYMTKGIEHVTTNLISNTIKDFIYDIKISLHPDIYKILLKNYFNSSKAIDIFLIEYFYNKINAYELKNKKLVFDYSILIDKGK